MATNEAGLVHVFRKTSGDSQPVLITRFLTRYAARRFVLHQLTTEKDRSGVRWFIQTFPKYGNHKL